ncbi:MAG TPA: type II toxin-antitoxin system prevent-host-death family antitoxin [Candidatus Dormibacteraeota bacterium]|nr:type II toxin-antitoxin system prevent-host-death family antitoxin [Candidatus Dormibacteraeota bacterium]
MIKAEIRELRQNASNPIRRVIEGETIEVTEWGRPVARIVPLHGRRVIDRMVAEVVTYDARISAAAQTLGLPVIAPR